MSQEANWLFVISSRHKRHIVSFGRMKNRVDFRFPSRFTNARSTDLKYILEFLKSRVSIVRQKALQDVEKRDVRCICVRFGIFTQCKASNYPRLSLEATDQHPLKFWNWALAHVEGGEDVGKRKGWDQAGRWEREVHMLSTRNCWKRQRSSWCGKSLDRWMGDLNDPEPKNYGLPPSIFLLSSRSPLPFHTASSFLLFSPRFHSSSFLFAYSGKHAMITQIFFCHNFLLLKRWGVQRPLVFMNEFFLIVTTLRLVRGNLHSFYSSQERIKDAKRRSIGDNSFLLLNAKLWSIVTNKRCVPFPVIRKCSFWAPIGCVVPKPFSFLSCAEVFDFDKNSFVAP